MIEEFADIPGYEGHYQISNLGNVRSIKKAPFIILKPMTATNGYLVACLWLHGKQRKLLIHRLVANSFLDNPNGYPEINHIDEDKTNNCVDNLEWCTHLYNMNYGAIKQKISDGNKGKKLSEAHRAKMARSSSQHRWVNDGVSEKFVFINKVSDYLSNGWQKGRNPRRRKIA